MKRSLTVLLLTTFLCGVAAASEDAAGIVDKLARFRFDKLGHPQIKSDSIAPVLASKERPHRLLILPVAFSDVGYDRFAGDPEQEIKNRRYFTELLFAGGVESPQPGTLSDYYRHQSHGRYNITGDVMPTVKLERPLHYYGQPVQNSDGTWRSDERSGELVADALLAAYRSQPDFPWRDYDIWDPLDFDGDGNHEESDGYLDHLVLIVAGKGQETCQSLYGIEDKLNENSSRDAFQSLTAVEQACANRIWSHRNALSDNLGKGPVVGGKSNPRGGIALGNGLWFADYNVQNEYTDASTFIHEFGHSLGLPDIYAGSTSNSTGSWDSMSATSSPLPQELSSWSRMVLGWLEPCVVRPPSFGGPSTGTLELKTMNEWPSTTAGQLCDAAMIILPPKYRDIALGTLTASNGKLAAYSGQGNDMQRSMQRHFDFSDVDSDTDIILSLDSWFEIEAEWDYLYVEVAAEGQDFVRLMPTDKSAAGDRSSVMNSNRGHEGEGSLPGFTGLSGDKDGDGKVETAPGCDPARARTLAEDKFTRGTPATDPCEAAQWITSHFDLNHWRGRAATLRFHYFTDTASVENGALLDNISIPAIGFAEDFEDGSLDGWTSNGFTISSGRHHLAVPHFYLLEFRDPYATFAGGSNYDAALAEPGFMFYPDGAGAMQAINVNYRPGLLMWYYNGEYLWSQNEPAELGPGNGFLLVVDAIPQEFQLAALPDKYFKRNPQGWTAWEFDDSAQAMLKESFLGTMCYQRRQDYYPDDIPASDLKKCRAQGAAAAPPMEALSWHGRTLQYGFTIINEVLPGADRDTLKSGSSLFDLRLRDGEPEFRLDDRSLRNVHSADAPFSLDEFAPGLEVYTAQKGLLTRVSTTPFPAVTGFSDAAPNSYQSPLLPFGGANIPQNGFSFELSAPTQNSPVGSRVRVNYRWAIPGTPGQ